MSTKTEGKHAGEFLKSEAHGTRSREAAIVLSGENLSVGHILGRRLVGATVNAAAVLNTNTGNGTVTGQAIGTNLGVQRGTYRLTCLEPATNAGVFAVYAPDGQYLGDATVAVAFDNQIAFTIGDGATDFIAGDSFTISVTGGSYKYKEYDPTDADGGQRPAGVLYDAVDASGGDKAGVAIARDAEVRAADLTWFSGATTAQKTTALDALAALGIIAR